MSCLGMSSLDCDGWSLPHNPFDCKMDGRNEEMVENMLDHHYDIHRRDDDDGGEVYLFNYLTPVRLCHALDSVVRSAPVI